MTKTENEILEAAMRMFSRYGVKRTSMSDLAQEAGISRQTLYNAYKNKDDVLRALIRAFSEHALDEIEVGLRDIEDPGEQLDIVFDKLAVSGFDLVAATPNAQDIIDGFNSAGTEELNASADKFRVVIARILSPHDAALARSGLSVSDLSDFVQKSAKAAGRTARDRDHLVRQLQTLKHLCLAAIGK